MNLVDRINDINKQQKQNQKEIQKLNAEILELNKQKTYYDSKISRAVEYKRDKKHKTIRIMKWILIILIFAVAIGVSILAYYYYPFGEPNHTEVGGKTYNWFGLISIWLINLLVTSVGIIKILKRKELTYKWYT